MNSQGVRMFCFFFCLLAARISLGGESEAARAAADALAAIRGSGKACPASWSNAAVEKVERLDLPSGMWHLAHVAADGKPAGYVLLLQQDNTPTPVMYSGSSFPRGLESSFVVPINTFPIPGIADFTPIARKSWMVAPFDPGPDSQSRRVRVEPLACALASVFMAWQSWDDSIPPLLIGDGGSYESYWARLAPRLAEAGLVSTPVSQKGPPASPGSLQRANEYKEELKRAFRDSGLVSETGIDPQLADLGPDSMKAKSETIQNTARTFMVAGSLIRRTLAGTISPFERFLAMRDEETYARFTGVEAETSAGMLTALYLQRAYLNTSETIEGALDSFFEARGVQVTCLREAVPRVLPDELPCVLLGPNNRVMVLVSVSGAHQPEWATVWIPETVVPKRSQGLDSPLSTTTQLAHSPIASDQESQLNSQRELLESVSRKLPPEVRVRLERAGAAASQRLKNAIIIDDRSADGSESLDYGTHVIALRVLEQKWQALVLRDWRLRENWDFEGIRE